jgi:hypothetical protein
VRGCARTGADDTCVTTFGHATAALSEPGVSDALREHRGFGALLLAERGIVPVPSRNWDGLTVCDAWARKAG